MIEANRLAVADKERWNLLQKNLRNGQGRQRGEMGEISNFKSQIRKR
jgi:hypothetical protein